MAKNKKTKAELELMLELAEKYHRELVAKIVRKQPELLIQLFEPSEDTRIRGNGPPMPNYSEARHKNAVYLSGANVLLLKELVRRSQEQAKRTNNPHKQTKSAWINTILEQWLASEPDIKKLIR